MKPDVPVVLGKVAQTLLVQIGPEITSGYAQGSALVASMLLQAASEEWDRAAARRVEENEALRRLFREAHDTVGDPDLERRLAEAGAGSDDDLKLSSLDRSNDALRGLLISLHAHVEELSSAAAREVEQQIWRELRRSTERRALSIAPF